MTYFLRIEWLIWLQEIIHTDFTKLLGEIVIIREGIQWNSFFSRLEVRQMVH